MIFAADNLTVGLVATHLPLKDIPKSINRHNYNRTIKHVLQVVKSLTQKDKPHIAVAALNPHAGENGLLGTEEKDIIEPVCFSYVSEHKETISGPFPADTVFRDAFSKIYDGVVSAYHDQAMIPLKLNGPGATVNVTMGLPFIRTSPDHGVAYNLARQNRADPGGMGRAIKMAATLLLTYNT
jgi:4-hydroxythreonine-4-phosphate dehydrogenase